MTDTRIDSNTSIEKIRQNIENKSRTRLLSKCEVAAVLADENDAEHIYVHDNCIDAELNVEGKPIETTDQFLQKEAVLFRFAEIVRKFIIETKFLKNNQSLWPFVFYVIFSNYISLI